MKTPKIIILSILLLISLPFVYGGCVVVYSSGSIGKEREIKDDDTSIGIDGLSSFAIINSENADRLVGNALAGGRLDAETEDSIQVQSSDNFQYAAARPLKIPLVMGDALLKIEIDPRIISYSRTDRIFESGIFFGSCGGSFSYNLDFSKDSEEFSGRISFENYCDLNFQISGETYVKGSYGTESGTYLTVEYSFDELATDTHIFEGVLSIDYADTPIMVLLNIYSRHTGSGEVFRTKDYSMNISQQAGHAEIEVFGTFYHPQYGYVEMTTIDPFGLHDDDRWPTSGQMVISGSAGTKARLTVMDQAHVDVAADTDGDGLYDWDSGILDWDEL